MNTHTRTVTPETLGGLDHQWMAGAACARRLDLPWTDDAHRVEDEIRDAMARVCRACLVRGCCRRYAEQACTSAGFWAGGFRDGVDPADLLDLLAELDEQEVVAHHEPNMGHARQVHRKALVP